MSTKFLIPTEESIQKMLSALFGEDFHVSAAGDADLDGAHAATYVDETDNVVAACVCDVQFVAYSGAALSMIPAGVAQDALNGAGLTEAIVGNFHEVMNICSRLLMSDSTPHLRLDRTLDPAAARDVVASLGGSASNFGVTFPGYGDGTISFHVT